MSTNWHHGRKARLVALGLQNFQTIADYQEIRLGRLTFLYGPNSAGKSAFVDAVEVGRCLWSDVVDETSQIEYQVTPWADRPVDCPIFHRHWRRSGQERLGNLRLDLEINASHALFQATADDRIWSDFLYKGSERCKGNDGNINIGLKVDFRPANLNSMLIELADQGFVKYSGAELSVNIDHPFFRKNNKTTWHYLHEAISVAEKGMLFDLTDGWLKPKFMIKLHWDRTIDCKTTAEWAREYAEDDEMYSHVENLESDRGFLTFVDFYRELQIVLSQIVLEALEVQKVPASRNVPGRQELTYLLDSRGFQVGDPLSFNSIDEFGVTANGDLTYEPLVSACVVEFFHLLAESSGNKNGDKRVHYQRLGHHGRRILDAVNDALRHHLLLDVEEAYQPPAYQIAVDLKLLVKSSEFAKLIHSDSEDIYVSSWVAALARLQLVDENGLMLEFDEVGSGIGYVLPVLVTIHAAYQSFIQQPELHLHPALQSAVGDIFIEAANRGGLVIVESHSEHILLRVLRRIRQSSAGRLEGSSLQIDAEDVAVYFFEPTTNRSTRVKRLRITPDGDFMDRWPGGFFAERDRELFDE